MNATSISALPAAANLPAEAPSVAMQVETLRLLLLGAAQALCGSDVPQVQKACDELTSAAVNLRPAWGDLFPNRSSVAAVECEQQRQRLLLPLLEARAFYLAGLRRWRRCLRLRHSLMDMQTDAPAYGDAELSRWC